MVRFLRPLLLAATALALPACAGNQAASLARKPATVRTASVDPAATGTVTALGFAATAEGKTSDAFPLLQSFRPAVDSPLAGRILTVSRIADIQLAEKEVVLTFDDGPVPEKTERILDTLDRYGVGATFLMVGEMAKAHPKIAQAVAERGHTIGTHTERHRNLSHMSDAAAMAEIRSGQLSVARALEPIGREPAPFFRFPYLADRPSLRQRLTEGGIVAIDVDVDSKDYFQTPASMVKDRTLLSLEKHGRGIILFHDIHRRTAEMLPDLLAALQTRGFKVVRLVPPQEAPLVAALDRRATGL
ncbi:polysaccharide deacetylase family protein [Aurantimonas sp. Leaf443]|uniref:polysaccharide deacetylase family protein n=1 Tax=Aurantimonas sp. Leaf443 TaxID=1736378 RepID=UPI0006F47057|nr:polysaccharide deacetylase family protein [Aurantimonas sp. Leaf443]KQT85734.1 hypothetical protein ASG48_03685 [Aurantimonas sp. Leaf443]